MEDVAAERVTRGNNSSAQVDPDPMCLASFDDGTTGPLALPCSRDDALVHNGAAAPKPTLLPVEMRKQTTAGGLLPAGTASAAMRNILPRQFFSWSLGEIKKRTSRINNQVAPFWRRAIQTKSRQTPVFDPGGSTGRLRACSFLGTWRALLSAKLLAWAPDGTRGWLKYFFWQKDD